MRGWVVGVMEDSDGTERRLLVILAAGRRLVTDELSSEEQATLGPSIAQRLRPPHPGARSVVRWLHPVLAVTLEFDGGRATRVAVLDIGG